MSPDEDYVKLFRQSFLEMLSACSQEELSAAIRATISEPEADGTIDLRICGCGGNCVCADG